MNAPYNITLSARQTETCLGRKRQQQRPDSTINQILKLKANK